MQHDVDAREFGYPLGQIPRMETLAFEADENLRKLAKEAVSYTHLDVYKRQFSDRGQHPVNSLRRRRSRI